MIKFTSEYGFLEENVLNYQDAVTKMHKQLHHKTYLGNDYLGWLDWASNYDVEEFNRINTCAKTIRQDCEVFLVCGIGGSYLGSRSAIEMLLGNFPKEKIEIIFCGNTFSSTCISQLLDYLDGKSVYMNVISKSGTTTETAIAFRLLRQYIEKRYGKEAKNRIIATTDKSRGTLKYLADQKGYQTFVIPDDIGGRFSVITPVGLLPMAVMGIDIDQVMAGYQAATDLYNVEDLKDNPCYQYAVARRILDNQGYSVETLVTYEPQMIMIGEWWKQLFGESEGKNGLGLLPTSVNYSMDLHSLGQFVQDGRKILFETLLLVDQPMSDLEFTSDEENLDQMNYLSGKSIDYINKMACKGTLAAHYEDGKVPNLIVTIEKIDAYNYGMLIYYFFKAIAMTVYLNSTNPFDQPGVEIYKKRMFQLLGKE